MAIIRAYQLVSTSNVDVLNGRAYQSSTSQVSSSFAQHIVHYNKINQSRNDSMMDMSSIIPDDLELFEDRSVSTKFKSLVKGSSFKSLLKSQKQVEESGDGAAAPTTATATSEGIELSNMPSSPGASKLKTLVKGSSFKSLIKSHTQQQVSDEKITLNATLGEDQDTTAATGRSRASLDLEDAHGEEWMATQQPELRFRVASQTLKEAGGGRGMFSNIRYRHSSFESSEVVKLTERSRAKSFGPGKLRKTTLFGGGTVAEKPIELENLPTLTEYVNR
jgi:hypothetical protein